MGGKIKKYLKENGLKQKHIANKANIEVNRFSCLMNGKAVMALTEYADICQALGLSLDYFVNMKGE